MDSNQQPLTLGEYMCTREGDNLSTLAASYRMTFRDKILFSEKAEQLNASFQNQQKTQLVRAMETWCQPG